MELTGKERPSAQRRELELLGIPCKARSDGSPIVLWEDVRATHNIRPKRSPQLRIE